MIILIYSNTRADNLESQLGRPEYSYYFVLKEFRPVLEQLGIVIPVTDPAREVDRIYRNCRAQGQDCIFLSFTAPQNTLTDLECPTLPVFAWEFSTLPTETWDEEQRNDWRYVFNKLGGAITHSRHACRVVHEAMGEDFPIVSIPAPVWDRFDALRRKHRPQTGYSLQVAGTVIDSRSFDLDIYRRTRLHEPRPVLLRDAVSAHAHPENLHLSGVVYTAIFNPFDSRKNWFDLICAFCLALHEQEDATLVLKLTHFDPTQVLHPMLEATTRMVPMRCRVVFVHGMLDDASYETLMNATTYAVNASTGEGQCLPLMEAMSAGKPALAPRHTAMRDYLDADNGFIVAHTMEPTFWHQDPRQFYRTLQARIEFDSLMQAYRDSYTVATTDLPRYARMSAHANERLRAFCSSHATRTRLTEFLARHLNPSPQTRERQHA